eukprot:CAMPEP_0202921488 /NCGR_PEP_ID=MMETSP1392-20130828/77419_1 /ASSEMBLY_ACC=CAM_ASM_000868 /TAXON_ID=225041 /ORGANISM="Chlamydomonas chlamydogama, Strain SAG 11-48b" /LENGTH=147 /DNA_ID=CAMNT_0049615059 /DNA_START=2239 /DNA_END=2682 /DNA_ORIENTATION=+
MAAAARQTQATLLLPAYMAMSPTAIGAATCRPHVRPTKRPGKCLSRSMNSMESVKEARRQMATMRPALCKKYAGIASSGLAAKDDSAPSSDGSGQCFGSSRYVGSVRTLKLLSLLTREATPPAILAPRSIKYAQPQKTSRLGRSRYS